jgi:hypothetical protein
MTAAQRPMATAFIYPEAEKLKRKGAGSFVAKDQGFSQARLSMARAVLARCSYSQST